MSMRERKLEREKDLDWVNRTVKLLLGQGIEYEFLNLKSNQIYP